jgi:3-oxoacyl-[acyl-carrier protein] reductase
MTTSAAARWDFTGRTVLVTGASTGIGLGIAQAFAQAGANVAMAARGVDRLDAAAAALRAAGYKAEAFALDVADQAAVRAVCARIAKTFGGIDILCANAGIYPVTKLDDLTGAEWDEVMNVNVKGTFFCVQACLPYLRAAGVGRIILTSSITGPVTGISGLSHYGASKAAQLGFMRTAAMELAKDGITVNAVLPGLIETEALAALGDAYVNSAISLIPVGRIGQVRDIAGAAMFFAAPETGFITGQGLIIDGGQTLPEAPE